MDRMIRQLLTVATLACAVALLAGAHASAQQAVPMTNEHIERIRENCSAADRTLSRLHANDALLRVNRGQLYDLISTKLMARMNSRLAINRLDASRLVSSTASFDRTLSEFRSRYQQYEERLSATLRIDCRKQPVEFYDSVSRARELRQSVHESVQNLGQFLDEYRNEFDTFQTNFHQAKTGEAS
jgi:hypothetical protein